MIIFSKQWLKMGNTIFLPCIIICTIYKQTHGSYSYETNDAIDYSYSILYTNDTDYNSFLCRNYDDFCLDFHRQFSFDNVTNIENLILSSNCTCYKSISHTFDILNMSSELISNQSSYYDRLYQYFHNEYIQLNKYMEREIDFSADEEHYVYFRMDKCNKQYLDYCGEEIVYYLNNNHSLFWNETSNTTNKPYNYISRFKTDLTQSFRKSNIDCRYDIVDSDKDYNVLDLYDIISLNMSSEYKYRSRMLLPIDFKIIQSNCLNSHINHRNSKYIRNAKKMSIVHDRRTSNTSSTRRLDIARSTSDVSTSDSILYGGSTFEISMESNNYIVTCQVLDRFTNEYLVHCLLPFDEEEIIHNKICGNLTIILDFEHYSAYSDVRLTPVKLRYHIGHNMQICRDTRKALSVYKNIAKLSLTSNINSNSAKFYRRLNKYTKGFYRKNRNVNYQPELQWSGDNSIFINQAKLDQCVKQFGSIIFVGSSHMRFNFDHMVYSYVNKGITTLYIHCTYII